MAWTARYRVLRHLGAGAAGGVYLVEDRALPGPPLALKRVEASSDPNFHDSLVREFAVLASLSLPRVARVYDLGFVSLTSGAARAREGEVPEGMYFTRGYVSGEPLAEYAAAHSLSERLSAFARTLGTISLLHRAGVVHGDLKPGNIIVDAAGEPHVIDFGLSSRVVDAQDLRGSGTPLYMAPELLRGGLPSVQGDIYALGATLWALITGRAPHEELGSSALASKLRGERPRFVLPADDPRAALLEVAHWALASDPRERAPSADELLARLEQSAPSSLQTPHAPSATEVFASPRTRGREGVLATLLELASRGPCVAVLVGASGMGKSTLLRELKWRLQLSRVRVLEVRCAGVGLEPFVQLLRQLSLLDSQDNGALSALLEQVEAGTAEPRQLVKAVSQALAERQDDGHLVLLVDDIDHAEPLLAETLRLAVHAEKGSSLALLASSLTAQDRSTSELGAAQHIALPQLADEDLDALVRDMLGAVDTAAAHALLARAAGNPGVLVEAASQLRDRPGLTAGDVAAVRVGAIGDRLARARCLTLLPEELGLLHILAVAGRPIPESVASAMLARPIEELVNALIGAGLALRERDSLSLSDMTFGEWLRGELGDAGQAQLARRLLSLSGVEELDIVTRAELALLASDATILRVLALPAATLLRNRGALSAARRLLEQCHARGEPTDELQLMLAELCNEGGDAAQGAQHAENVLTRVVSPELRARALLCAATALVSVGKLDRACELLDGLPTDAPAAARAQSSRVLGRVLLRRGELDKARLVVARGIAAADPDDVSLPELLAIDAWLAGVLGQRDAAQATYERALALAQRLGLKRDAAQVLGYRALGYEREGNLERARSEYESCLGAARDAGDLGLTATYAMNLGNISFRTGHPTSAEQNFELAGRLSRRAGRSSTALLANNNLADVHVYLGSYGRAQQLAEASLKEARELSVEVAEAQANHTIGNVEARTKRPDGALSRYERAAALYRKLGRSREATEVLLDAAELLLERGGTSDVSLASARLAAARELIEQHLVDDFRPRLKLLVSLVRAKNGDLEQALAELEALEAQLDPGKNRELWWQLAMAQAGLYQKLGSDVLCAKKAREAAELLEGMAARVSRDTRDAFRADPRRRKVFELAQAEKRDPSARTGSSFGLTEAVDARLTRLLEILKRLARERDEARVLERITDAAVELSGAERGFVLLVDEHGQLCPHTVREGRGVEQDAHVAFSRSIAEAVLIDMEPIITVNARDDARVNEYMSVHKLALKSVACIPINGPRGVTGVLYLEHRMRAGRFQDSDVDLLLAFADQAAIALENAALWSENERRKHELTEANAQLSLAKADIERLLEARTEELEQAKAQLSKARAELEVRYQRHGIVGQSQAIRRVFAMIERVADSNIPVVVQGESGTGKELVARAIHFGGTRKRAPFIAVNCAAIPDQLLESELFGHVRGAFTGAERDRKGVFIQANGGTLFLDEFADMSARMQIDLLRVLQESKIRPVGADADLPVDVRVIVATNRPLEKLLSERSLREDLYYRLSVVELRLPPLRERTDDIPLLCQHFLSRIAEQNKTRPLAISREAVDRIVASGLPGNVRQLEHLLMSAAVMAEGHTIEADDLPFEGPGGRQRVSEHDGLSAVDSGEELLPADLQTFKVREKERILAALDKHAWNRAKAATALGMPRRTFYRRLSEFGIL